MQISCAVTAQLISDFAFFCYLDNTITLLLKSKILSFYSSSAALQAGLCQTWSETPKTCFLELWLLSHMMFSTWHKIISCTSVSLIKYTGFLIPFSSNILAALKNKMKKLVTIQKIHKNVCDLQSSHSAANNLFFMQFLKDGVRTVGLKSGFKVFDSWPRGYKTFFSCSTQLRLKFILLINVKMPTIVGILTFISRINYRLWQSKSKIATYLGYFIIYEQFKI